MTIAVDFDGTIVEHRYPAIGSPMPFAIETLIQLEREGHQLILWTVREGRYLDEAVDYLHQNGVKLYAVNTEYPGAAWTGSGVSRKIKADVYIDDRNLGGLPDWGEIYNTITGHGTEDDESVKNHHRHKRESALGRLFRQISDRCQASRSRVKM